MKAPDYIASCRIRTNITLAIASFGCHVFKNCFIFTYITVSIVQQYVETLEHAETPFMEMYMWLTTCGLRTIVTSTSLGY